MSELYTLYKLIVLYMLQQVTFPLTKSQISEFILEQEYTTYFTLQKVLAECIDTGLIREEKTHQRTTYYLTEEGSETIEYFYTQISPGIIDDIDIHLKSQQYDLRDDSSVSANYYLNSNREYSVNLQVIEKKAPVIDLTISVPSETVAETIANNWTKNNQAVYALIMGQLLQ